MTSKTKHNKKILFLDFDCSKHPYFETSLELMEKCKENGSEIYSIHCKGILDKYCCNHVRRQTFNRGYNYCKKCTKGYAAGMKMLNIPRENRFVIHSTKTPEFPIFKTIDELKRYSFEDLNVGFGIASTVMTYTRDYNFNPQNQNKMIQKLLKNSYIIYKNLEDIYKKIKFDEIYLFNGRYYEFNIGIAFAIKYCLDYYIYESGADYTKYLLRKNVYVHDFKYCQEEIVKMWEEASDSKIAQAVVDEWAINRKNGVQKNWWVFTEKQTVGQLPADFDKTKENIVIYNTSMDEVAIFDEYNNPIDKNDNNIIREIIKRYDNDDSKHFYLRIHPNLSNLETSQMKELWEITTTNPKCMTIIPPTDIIDTYALMDACKKVLVFCSTMGIEATYWGKPSILAGVALYDHLDCIHKASNYNELWQYIDDKNLSPKPKENTYPYLYWMNSFGTKFDIYEPKRLFTGKYRGVDFGDYGRSLFTILYKKLRKKLGLKKD